MNFLAHLYLADPTPASRIGNLLPDLVPGPLDPSLPPELLAGARNHQRVDAFTDTHPVFARSRARLRERHGRFSAILTDLFYDHVLASNWDTYHDLSLDRYIDSIHADLATGYDLMPEAMQPVIGRFIEQQWLRCYATPEGLAVVLGMMSRRFTQRLNRPIDLTRAVDVLPEVGDGLTGDFAEFFPQLVRYVDTTDVRISGAYIVNPTDTAHSNTPAGSLSELSSE